MERTMETYHLDQAEFADNPEPRCPVVLVLDTSGSMKGEPVLQLNTALREFSGALKQDHLASLRVELAIITFGSGVRAIDVRSGLPDASDDVDPNALLVRPKNKPVPFDARQAFATVDQFRAPVLDAGGDTPMGEAMRRALELLKARKEVYKQNGLDYFRPWIFLITDGKPTDRGWELAAEQVRQEEERKGVVCYAVGVEKADMNVLARFSAARQPLKLKGLAFGDLFQWLSKSLSVIAHSRPGEQAPLPPVGWGEIDTTHS
jgi:uncharacterized protein YegL